MPLQYVFLLAFVVLNNISNRPIQLQQFSVNLGVDEYYYYRSLQTVIIFCPSHSVIVSGLDKPRICNYQTENALYINN